MLETSESALLLVSISLVSISLVSISLVSISLVSISSDVSRLLLDISLIAAAVVSRIGIRNLLFAFGG